MIPGQLTLRIAGMSCQHCVGAVRGALERVPGVFGVEVSLEPKQAVVTYDISTVPDHALLAAVEGAGFEATLA